MRVGGVTLSLLPNLASESATAGRGEGGVKGGVVVGETDISGLRLLEAHFGLDWAADGLDLISLDIAPYHLHLSIHIHSLQLHPCLCTELFTTKLLRILSPHTRYLKHAVPYTDPISATLSSHKDPVPRTQLPHKHTSVRRRTTCPNISLPITHSPSIHPTSISEGLL